MSAYTLGTLKEFILAQSTRSGTAYTSAVSGFISLAENMVSADLRAMEMVDTITLTEADRVDRGAYNLPEGYLGLRSAYSSASGTAKALINVGLDEIKMLSSSSTPAYYAIYGHKIEFRGIPAEDAEIDLIYFARPSALDADEDTNDILTAYPSLYIHASLHWLHMRAQDLELAQVELKLYNDEVQRVNALASEQRGSGRVLTSAAMNVITGSSM